MKCAARNAAEHNNNNNNDASGNSGRHFRQPTCVLVQYLLDKYNQQGKKVLLRGGGPEPTDLMSTLFH